ncbi:Long-chain-alcohol dehydrogenase 2 [Vibrio stylophorae]|uniref:Long-chain-alcohol dehydrogenase 2 n=1 Tax=Vibrio stylophorae TaxID=659351 RepID=A0ABN8DSI4_9VIBR|nr:iron-containing alcohol dehydrogenase [Vibrio stylophorae]CAH0532765.1 Long-chain-alcohol dehydrogenase 2 [Vibrio stylophorae]
MDNFKYTCKTEVHFGKDEHLKVGEYIRPFGQKVLIHYDGNRIETNGLLDAVTESLRNQGIDYVTLNNVVPNPLLSGVHEGVALCVEQKIDFILAIGGGSVIDSAKSIAMGVPYAGDVWDFFTGQETPQNVLPVGVILTICGSGSEMSESAIITHDELKLKKGVDNAQLYPRFAILNPELTFSLPKPLLASGIADAVSHTLERYFTTTECSLLNDYMMEGLLKMLLDISPALMQDNTNYNLMSEYMWAATICHNGLFDTGRSSDWASHRIEHEISGLYNITHGAGMAIIFPAWMKHLVEKNKLERLVRLAENLFDVKSGSDLDKANAAIAGFEQAFKAMNLSISLTESNIPLDEFDKIAQQALNGNETLGRYIQLNHQDIIRVLELAS